MTSSQTNTRPETQIRDIEKMYDYWDDRLSNGNIEIPVLELSSRGEALLEDARAILSITRHQKQAEGYFKACLAELAKLIIAKDGH